MATWQEESVTLVRAFVDDIDATRYTDERLETLVAVAAFQVRLEVDLPAEYEVDVANATIDPDPSDEDTRDENFVNLISLKAACIIDRGAASRVSGQAIRIKDGTSEIDLRAVPAAKLALLKQGGWCPVYEDAKDSYITGQAGGVVGAAVVSPFRVFVGYGYQR